ncbi:MAG: TIGR02597 family protein [Verrucomicrobiota bacterium]
MSRFNFKSHLFFALAFCMGWTLIAGSVIGQTATSRIVGYNSTTCLGGSDTFVSIPFHQAPAYSGSVEAQVQFNNAAATVEASGTPGWTANQFAGTHYVKFTTGSASGLILEISANTANSFTVDPTGFGSIPVRADDRFLIIPHWTLATLLPPATQATLHQSTGSLLPQRGSELLFYETTSEGVEPAPGRIYYATSSGWFQNETGAAADNVVIPPHSAFIVRHQTGTANTFFRPAAHVDVNLSAVLIASKQGQAHDNILAIIRPIPVQLDELGLTTQNFRSSSGTGEAQRKDEILIFDNAAVGHNKVETARYFFFANTWRLDDGASYPVSNDIELSAGSVVVIRKVADSTNRSFTWSNAPNY